MNRLAIRLHRRRQYLFLFSFVLLFSSITLREAYRLRVFDNRERKKIFGPERDELTGKRRRLRVEELYDLYCSLDFIGVNKS